MKIFNFIVAALITVSIIACSPSREKSISAIAKMENDLKKAEKIDTNLVVNLINAYQNFASRYSKDSLAPEFLYKAAGVAVGFNKGTQAISIYQDIETKYPAYLKLPECLFMEAFTYENVIRNTAMASELYNKFLSKYPTHDLSDDAASALKYLGKSPDEMIKEFEKMQAAKDSADVAKK